MKTIPSLSTQQSLRLLTAAIEGLCDRWSGSYPTHEELRKELDALAMFAYAAHVVAEQETPR